MNQLSEKLADFAPQLTLDFIHEVSASLKVMGKEALASGQCSTCIHYMSPWIKNLAHFVNPAHNLYERSGARLRDCIITLAELAVAFSAVSGLDLICLSHVLTMSSAYANLPKVHLVRD